MKVVFTTLCALLLGAAVANKPVPDDAALEAAADREHEQRKVKVYFDSLDENGDGFLTADEAEDKIAGVVRMLLEVDLDSPTLKPYKDKARTVMEATINTLDQNDDEKLSLDEVYQSFASFEETIANAQRSFMEMLVKTDL